MKQLSRRLFLKVASAVPFAAKDAAAETAKQAGLIESLGVDATKVGLAPTVFPNADHGLKLIGLAKTGMLPEWFAREKEREARQAARLLDTDLAAMRSVSVSAKIAIQTERNRKQLMSNIVQDVLDNNARGVFWGWFGGGPPPQ